MIHAGGFEIVNVGNEKVDINGYYERKQVPDGLGFRSKKPFYYNGTGNTKGKSIWYRAQRWRLTDYSDFLTGSTRTSTNYARSPPRLGTNCPTDVARSWELSVNEEWTIQSQSIIEEGNKFF